MCSWLKCFNGSFVDHKSFTTLHNELQQLARWTNTSSAKWFHDFLNTCTNYILQNQQKNIFKNLYNNHITLCPLCLPYQTVITFWLKPFLDRLLCCSIVTQFDFSYPYKTQIDSTVFDEIKVNVVPMFKLRFRY